MRPLVGMVTSAELGEGPGGSDAAVVGVEGGVNHQPPVVHQAGVVDGLEGVVVHAFTRDVQENLYKWVLFYSIFKYMSFILSQEILSSVSFENKSDFALNVDNK